MTETVSGPAKQRGNARKGMKIERVFSTEGVHPYDEVTWERRDVVQTNWKTGETVFEQRGVEFPDFWSVNASTIVTTKYFRGALGTDARESSLRQLIDRVVRTYTAAGVEHGIGFVDSARFQDRRAVSDPALSAVLGIEEDDVVAAIRESLAWCVAHPPEAGVPA